MKEGIGKKDKKEVPIGIAKTEVTTNITKIEIITRISTTETTTKVITENPHKGEKENTKITQDKTK